MLRDIPVLIDSCRRHLKETNTHGTEIESYLAEYLLIHICAEWEKEYARIVKDRAQQSADNELATFIINKTDVRSIKIENLKGNILKLFNEKYPAEFSHMLENHQKSARQYENIIINRNSVAHGKDVKMSFDEVIYTYKSAEKVIHIFSEVINHGVSVRV